MVERRRGPATDFAVTSDEDRSPIIDELTASEVE